MLRLCILAVGALFPAAAAVADPGPLVDPEWVAEHACDEGIVVLDLRASAHVFQRGHIACSVHSSFHSPGWRAVRDGVPAMLPSPEDAAALIGGLGIGNEDHVIVVGPGGSPLATTVATRIYWTFKAFGHDRISLLNGGFAAFRRDSSLPLDRGEGKARPAKVFRAEPRPELLATAADIAAAAEAGVTLIDSRSSDYFVGINKVGIAARAGTLPGARNVPISWLTQPDGRFQEAVVLEGVAAATPLDGETPSIAFCNAGQMASLDWFVAHELLGNAQARVYDGSLAEWSADPDRPVERRIGGE